MYVHVGECVSVCVCACVRLIMCVCKHMHSWHACGLICITSNRIWKLFIRTHTTCLNLSWSKPVGNSKGESPLAANSMLFSLSSNAVYVVCVLLSHVQSAPHTLKFVGGCEEDGESDEEAVLWTKFKMKKTIIVVMMVGVGVMIEWLPNASKGHLLPNLQRVTCLWWFTLWTCNSPWLRRTQIWVLFCLRYKPCVLLFNCALSRIIAALGETD